MQKRGVLHEKAGGNHGNSNHLHYLCFAIMPHNLRNPQMPAK
jgi:hypothetical protein